MDSELNKLVRTIEKTLKPNVQIQKDLERIEKFTKSISCNHLKFDTSIVDKITPDVSFLNLSELEVFNHVLNNDFLKQVNSITKALESLKKDPEAQYVLLIQMKILNCTTSKELEKSLLTNLSDETINDKEELLDDNLIPYLEKLGLEKLWIGAGKVLCQDDNPDKLRQCLSSLRTLLEYLINEILAPMDELENAEIMRDHFKNNKQISRSEKIEYFISKFEYSFIDEFTKRDIQFVCKCYNIFCSIHKRDIGILENQVRSLKVKTGVTIWFLAHLQSILKNDNLS